MTEDPPARRAVRAAIWVPGLGVAIGAAVATAHGLYEVVLAAHVPAGIAWIYPLITDGLALVAYAATARLTGSGHRYAWTVVVLAAGLSGLAQAVYLASGPDVQASQALRFGIGAWPAIAAAVVAHLLHLLAGGQTPPRTTPAVQPAALNAAPVQPDNGSGAVQRSTLIPLDGGRSTRRTEHPVARVGSSPSRGGAAEHPAGRAADSPARDRAEASAMSHLERHEVLPTVTELEQAAGVSRGTAAAVLKALRDRQDPPRNGQNAPHADETSPQP